MSETESKSMEVEKENIEPITSKNDHEKTEKAAESDEIEIDLSEFTEEKMFADMIKCIENEELGASNSKKHFRNALGKKYNLKKKALKHHQPFKIAFGRIAEKLRAEAAEPEEQKEKENQQSKTEEAEEFKKAINPNKNAKKRKKNEKKAEKDSANEDEDEKEDKETEDNNENDDENDENDETQNENKKKKNKRKKKQKNKKKKSRKSRKRKLSSSDNDDNDNDNDNEICDPPRKKRKTNSGASVNDEFKEKKSKTNRKKKKSAPGEWTLKKLKKLLKVTNLANPKVYSEMKGKSIKKQVQFLQNIFQENDIDYSKLNDQRIKKIQREYALKKEMEELGIDKNNNGDDNEGRSKRKRTKICYNEVKSDRSGSESEEVAMEVEERAETSDEQYEPDSEEDSDEEYNDSDF